MRNKNVLIVEDDESIRETLQLALEMDGYTVSTASNGKVGLETLRQITKPCLILLDLMMPVMDGWEFAATLEHDSRFADIPIIVITAFDERARKIRVQGILKKPIGIETLLQTVGHYC